MLALILFATVALVMAPGMSKEGSGQHMHPGTHVAGQMVHSMGMMSEIMKDINQLTREGGLTPEQQQEISDMMNQMGKMMRQMHTPQGRQVEEEQHRQLTKMQKRLKAMKKQVEKQRKKQAPPGPKPQQEEHKQ